MYDLLIDFRVELDLASTIVLTLVPPLELYLRNIGFIYQKEHSLGVPKYRNVHSHTIPEL